ncbi:predicted protein [Histoplasma capsulatum var. duboisii H88]|uniref:Predicted protein n=1 Tax=Ajellomyces capsulatus (strain H88) TaxID=544711 RepID=F0UFA5_AJEC8|nr:predicted protein [Histoplasma capsulatum var. duboisii H88]QSS55689.1 hypothetical protein I7I53_03647 [Histoplasma capsulatum var. duboisii H88]
MSPIPTESIQLDRHVGKDHGAFQLMNVDGPATPKLPISTLVMEEANHGSWNGGTGFNCKEETWSSGGIRGFCISSSLVLQSFEISSRFEAYTINAIQTFTYLPLRCQNASNLDIELKYSGYIIIDGNRIIP